MKSFEEYIKQVRDSKCEDVTMEIKNKITKEYGIASLLPNGRVAIFEADETGKDDYICDLEEFKSKYEIEKVIEEYEEELE
ncbi:MAG: hypothetical protein ACI4VH_00185 [Clostridia bacterium]